jgi:cellobiose transport system substrate-binding protein
MAKLFANKRFLTSVSALALLGVMSIGITPAQAEDAPVKITVWSFGDVIQRDLVRQYQALHPNVTIEYTKYNLDDVNGTKLITQCSAYKLTKKLGGPDIVAVEVSYSGKWRSSPTCFQDLRKMETSTTNVAAGVKAGLSATELKNDYLPWRWAQGVGYDDSVIGIPTDVGGLEVAYRSDLFKAAGLPYQRDAVSKLWPTWDKFVETGKKYVAKLTTAQKKKNFSFIDDAGSIYTAMLNQGTSKYYANNGTDAGQLVYKTNPAIKKAWDTTVAAMNAGISSKTAQFTADWPVGMNNGKFAVILSPAWMTEYIKAQAPGTKGKWDIANIPVGGGNQGGTQLTIPAGAVNKQAAYDFMAWYLAPAQQLQMFKKYGLFPSTPSLYSDPSLADYKDPFFNNAPVGKIYSDGMLKLKPIFEGTCQRAIDMAFGAGLGRVQAKKQTSAASWTATLTALSKDKCLTTGN